VSEGGEGGGEGKEISTHLQKTCVTGLNLPFFAKPYPSLGTQPYSMLSLFSLSHCSLTVLCVSLFSLSRCSLCLTVLSVSLSSLSHCPLCLTVLSVSLSSLSHCPLCLTVLSGSVVSLFFLVHYAFVSLFSLSHTMTASLCLCRT